MPLAPGSIFAGYTIVRLLGAGGMGEVYLARHPRLPREDALKVLPAELSENADYRARFKREADLAATLWHPHIVGIHDRGECDGQLWIAMDFVDGHDAGQLLTERYSNGLPLAEVTEIVTAVAGALDYASSKGMLHRDVKPANIMIARPGDDGHRRILLADFGIARPTADLGGLTATNTTVGTIAYCAPEQLMGAPLDGRADLYALAATAYELLSGSLLFADSNPAVVISRQLNAPPPSLSATRPDLGALDAVLATALAKNPADRFERSSSFARALTEKSALDSAALKASFAQTEVARSGASRARETRPKRRWLAVAAALALAVVCASAAVVWHPWQTNRFGATANFSAPSPGRSNPQPPIYPAKRIDDALLSIDALSQVVGVAVTAKTLSMNETYSDRQGALNLESSSYGTQDHSRLVKPFLCAGIAYTDEHLTYAEAETNAIKTQSFTGSWGDSETRRHTPVRIEQTVAVLPSAKDARSLLDSAQSHWAACTGAPILVTLGFEDSWSYRLGDVRRKDDLIAVPMVSGGPFVEWYGCKQVMGVRANVVVEVRSCNFLSTNSNESDKAQWQNDPVWKLNSADDIAAAMLEQVKS